MITSLFLNILQQHRPNTHTRLYTYTHSSYIHNSRAGDAHNAVVELKSKHFEANFVCELNLKSSANNLSALFYFVSIFYALVKKK